MLTNILQRLNNEAFLSAPGKDFWEGMATGTGDTLHYIDARAPHLRIFCRATSMVWGMDSVGGVAIMLWLLRRAAGEDEQTRVWLEEHLRSLTERQCASEGNAIIQDILPFLEDGRLIVDEACPQLKNLLIAFDRIGKMAGVQGMLSTLAFLKHTSAQNEGYATAE